MLPTLIARTITIKLGNALYTVGLDSHGQPDLTSCSPATRIELAARIQITRDRGLFCRLHRWHRLCRSHR